MATHNEAFVSPLKAASSQASRALEHSMQPTVHDYLSLRLRVTEVSGGAARTSVRSAAVDLSPCRTVYKVEHLLLYRMQERAHNESHQQNTHATGQGAQPGGAVRTRKGRNAYLGCRNEVRPQSVLSASSGVMVRQACHATAMCPAEASPWIT